jgi:hypothetical protein
MDRKIFFLFISFVLYFYLLFVFVDGTKKIAPLNEEEWIAAKRRFIVKVEKEKGVILLNSLSGENNQKKEKVGEGDNVGGEEFYHQKSLVKRSAEIRKKFLFFEFIKRPLPPKLSVSMFGIEFDLLGWGHTGPISSIMFEISGKLRDLFGSFGSELVGLRILNIIILFSFAFYFAKVLGKISGAPFLISFLINSLFIHAGMLYYLLMTILTFLCFIFLERKNFAVFNLLSFVLCLTHLRGFVIVVSFVISFVLLEFIDREKENKSFQAKKYEELKGFLRTLLIFSPLYILAFLVYMIPSFVGGEIYEREAFEGFDIISSFFLEFVSKLLFLPQLFATRLGDFILSGNLYHILKELGITLKWKYFPFFSAVFNIFFFVPAFLSGIKENKLFFAFLGVYFVLSVIAVPFFFAMPWQFIPLSYIILLKTFRKLEEVKLKGYEISDYLSFIFSFLCFVLSFYMFSNSEKLFKPFLLYSEHKKVIDAVSEIKNRLEGERGYKDINILCITKSDIFYISFDCDLAGKYILFGGEQEFKRRMMRISQILDFYDVLILSYHFFDLYEIVKKKDDFYPVLKNDAFLVLIKKDFLFSGSSEQQK